MYYKSLIIIFAWNEESLFYMEYTLNLSKLPISSWDNDYLSERQCTLHINNILYINALCEVHYVFPFTTAHILNSL